MLLMAHAVTCHPPFGRGFYFPVLGEASHDVDKDVRVAAGEILAKMEMCRLWRCFPRFDPTTGVPQDWLTAIPH